MIKGQIELDFTREVPREVKFTETESKSVVCRGWGEGAGYLLSNGDTFSLERQEGLQRLVANPTELHT